MLDDKLNQIELIYFLLQIKLNLSSNEISVNATELDGVFIIQEYRHSV